MRVLNLRTAALAVVAGIGLGACAYNPYGGGLGVGVGYGNNGYYDPYYGNYGYYGGYPYGSRYGYGAGYGMPYYGWYNGYYYPGTGYYVYDRYRRPYRWTDAQRRYWEWRQRGSRPSGSSTGKLLEQWADFQQGPRATTNTVRQQSVTTSNVRTDRQRVRAERQQVRRSERAEARQLRVEERRERRRNRQAD